MATSLPYPDPNPRVWVPPGLERYQANLQAPVQVPPKWVVISDLRAYQALLEDRLWCLADREDDPQAEFQYLRTTLEEAGLADGVWLDQSALDEPRLFLRAFVRDNPDLGSRLTELGLPNHLAFPVQNRPHSPEGMRILKEINLAEWLEALTYQPTDDIGPPTMAERSA